MLDQECNWELPAPDLALCDNNIHVWLANLNLPDLRLQDMRQTLCDGEKERADRFVFDVHRRRYIAGRGFLRMILARYVLKSPSELVFSYSPRGKPELVSNSSSEQLYFNVSHSHDLALYAVARNRCVGVDVERIESTSNVEQLAERYFFPKEFDVIRSMAPERKNEAFFKGWTVKEAYVKATGEGLAEMEQVELSMSADGPAVLLTIHDNPAATARWSSCQMRPSPGYMAALVAEGQGWGVKHVLCV